MTGNFGRRHEVRSLAPGQATGRALVLDAPLSFWGGLDPATGQIIDQRHPQCGVAVTGRALVMPGGRGSSSSSSVLAEAIRAHTAPCAILLSEADLIITLGAMVAAEMYGQFVPIVVIPPALYATIRMGETITIDAGEERAAIEVAREG